MASCLFPPAVSPGVLFSWLVLLFFSAVFFVCFGSVLLYIKRAELEKTSGQGDESFMSPNPCLVIQSPEI